jgi:uncharacterized membrane protein YgcG
MTRMGSGSGRAKCGVWMAARPWIVGCAAACAMAAVAAPAQAYVYWSDDSDNTIARATLDGQQVQPSFTQGVSNPGQVVVDASHVYWTNYGVENGQLPIGRANLDGTEAVNDFILAPSPSTGQIGQMVADSSHLYWGHGPNIARATSDGSDINTAFAVAPGGNAGLAVDASHIYWSTNGDYFDAHPIARANLDGSGVNAVFIDNHPVVDGIAVDGLAPPPSSGGTTGAGGTTGTGGAGGSTGGGSTGAGGGSTGTPSRLQCVVPGLKGKTLGDARSALTRAHCALGKVNRPRTPAHTPRTGTRRSLVVKSESLRAGTRRPAGTSVSLALAYKTVKAGRHGTNT